MPPPPGDWLQELCLSIGIQPKYYDIWGAHHKVPGSALLAILDALGFDTSTPETLASAVAEREQKRSRQPLDPVCVISEADAAPAVPIRLPPASKGGRRISVALYLEDNRTSRFDVEEDALVDGKLPLPPRLPLGYHDLELAVTGDEAGTVRASMRIIVAPERAWLPERLERGGLAAGLAVSLYGLRSDRNWGAGDFTDLRRLVRWSARKLGAAFVALNPLHALHNRQPYNTSPYLPLSGFYRNILYLDVERVPDFEHCALARRIVGSARFQARLARLRAAEFVEYEAVAGLKRRVLLLLFRRFWRNEWLKETPRARAFRKFIAAEGDLLERFAGYCALDEVLHARNRDLWIWPDWPEQYRDPNSHAVREFAQKHRKRVLFHQYLQWQIDLQLEEVQQAALDSGMPVGLYHDLALATDRCGADLWAHRDYFIQGCRVGAPPDDFSPDGQDWAFPPPNTAHHRNNAYKLFVESIRKNARHGGALRIDHVMRFFRLFWIPPGKTPKEGTYVHEPWQDLLSILALESVRGRFLVVGEDLGTVPPELRQAMEGFGMLGYKLFYFEKDHEGRPKPPADFPRHVLVSSTTHDLPTLAGFWAGADLKARLDAKVLPDEDSYHRQLELRQTEKLKMLEALIRDGFLPQDYPREAARWTELTGELHNAIIGYLVSTPSMLMLLNEEDLTKELDQQNLPGTTWQYPNWRRKMSYSLDDLENLPRALDFAAMFRAWLEKTGRAIEPRP
jgi:4-alpha-glucanotransferase